MLHRVDYIVHRLRNYFGKYANSIDKVNLDTMTATMKSAETASNSIISANLMKIHIFDGLLSRHMSVQVISLRYVGRIFISEMK